MNQLVLELKQANEDFEFYPTTHKMFEKVKQYSIEHHSILDLVLKNQTLNF